MFELKVKKLNPEAKLPEAAHVGEDLGYDVFSGSVETVVIEPGEQKMIPTGLAFECESVRIVVEVPGAAGYVQAAMQVPVGLIAKQPSGLASKFSIDVKAGVIDPGYRNEVSMLLYNYGTARQTFKFHQKIAQLVPVLCLTGAVKEVSELSPSSRGVAGWGSGHRDGKTS
jgi:dUTP pyrophosphatase